jgi:hypothetical protein
MSSSMSGLGGMSAMTQGMGAMANRPRPDPSQMAEQLVSTLDTSGKGYLEASDIQSALDQMSTNDNGSLVASAEEVFSALDGDGDGKVTSTELAESFRTTADSLRLSPELGGPGGPGGPGGRPPPPPPSSDSSSTSTSTEDSTSTNSSTTSDAVMNTIMQLMRTYGSSESSSDVSARLSLSA